jgi:hypothetical protein
MMPSGHQLREAQREPGGVQVAGADAPSGSSPAAHAGTQETAADDGRAPSRRDSARPSQ